MKILREDGCSGGRAAKVMRSAVVQSSATEVKMSYLTFIRELQRNGKD